ncbi:LuxR C-terminal-related transcriptional regulator [Vibrio sp. TRT 29B02]|uniref:LuxR C-terminal-related transcriptional regulator n=1 Tax=Vibrio sp. TRT 29B02 TaxID=3418508 RepID=UPI003CEA9DC5
MNFLLIDAQPLFQKALESLIRTIYPNCTVYKESCAAKSSQVIRNKRIETVILDTEISNGSGIDYAKRLRSLGFEGAILFISSCNSKMYSQIARTNRANGLVYKTQDIKTIRAAILLVSQGKDAFESSVAIPAQKTSNLSAREALVLSYLAKGYSNKKISELLSLSNKTVSTYKSRILNKYNAKSIIEIISFQGSIS